MNMILDKLLKGYDVELKALGEIGEFIRGKRFVKTDIQESGFPAIHYGEMYTFYGVSADRTKSFINPELAKRLRLASYGDVVIVSAGETIEDIGLGTAWLGESEVAIHDACFIFRSELNPKYVAYFLRTKAFHTQIKAHISSGKISSINARGLGKAQIPVPSIEIQAKIVHILDTFTEIIQELAKERLLREKQYQYYCEKLLSFSDVTIETDSNRQQQTATDSIMEIFDRDCQDKKWKK